MKTKFRIAGLLAAGAASLALAACGSSSSGATAKHSYPASATSKVAATSAIVKTAQGPLGTYLVGPNGRALYLWRADSMNKSACSGACAKVWPPLTTTGSPGAGGNAMPADLGTLTRAGGTKQVTYKGHPLYYYTGDAGPGTTKGQGSNSFGAKWWLVAPSGAAITKGASSSSSSSAPSGGSSSGGGWG